jgi:RNA polymerase primary sigma factor
MIQANLRLVIKIAAEYADRGVNLDDLVAEGNVGLIRAVEQFEPRFGTRFSTYAYHWIKQSIRRAVLNATSMIRIPSHMIGLLNKWRRAERAIARERGSAPSFTELASLLGLSKTQSTLIFKAHRARYLKLEGSMIAEAGRWSPVEAVDPYPTPDTVLENDDERRRMLERMAALDGRERTILMLRYGLTEDEPLTLKEIGRRLGITREWVRKLELNAVEKLHGAAIERPSESNRRTRINRSQSTGRPNPGRAPSPSTSPASARAIGQGSERVANYNSRTGFYWMGGDTEQFDRLASITRTFPA